MNKNTLVSIFTASLLTMPVFATPLFQKLMPGKLTVHATKKAHKSALPTHNTPHYTDFSGEWSGTCVYDTEEMPVNLAIENTDSFMAIDGEQFKIGSLNTKTISDDQSESIDHSTLTWNHDLSVLTINDVGLEKIHSSPPHTETQPMITFLSEFTFSLNNDQLLLKGQFRTLFGLEQSELNEIHCTLNKE